MNGAPERRHATLLQTLRAVAWSFFGVRRRADHEEDVRRLNPVLVVAVGIAAALVFIAVLLLVVAWVVDSGVATA